MNLVGTSTFRLLRPCMPHFDSQIRLRGKINLRKPRKPHFDRALVLKLTEPYVTHPYEALKVQRPLFETCRNEPSPSKKKDLEQEPNRYQEILAAECLENFRLSKIVGFFHLNSIDGDEHYEAHLSCRENRMTIECYGRRTMEMALTGTIYENVLKFYCSRNAIVFAEHDDLQLFLKVMKKFSEIVLLAAIYNNRLLSRNEILKYSEIGDLQTARSQLVQVLNSSGLGIRSQLFAHQNNLCTVLGQIAEIKSGSDRDGGSNSSSAVSDS